MRLVKISAPVGDTLSVTVDEVREQLRADLSEVQEGLIRNAIRAAESQAENALNRKLLSQQWEVWSDRWLPEIRLDTLGNLQEVLSVEWTSLDGSTHQLPADAITVIQSLPAEIYLSGTAPSLAKRPDALRVRVKVGYGDQGMNIPECVRQWILYQVVGMYENRNPLTVGAGGAALDDRFVDGLLDPERIPCL